MAFTLRVRFTGACALVSDRDLSEENPKICVLLPEGGRHDDLAGERASAVDGKGLRRHFPILRFDFNNLAEFTNAPADFQCLRYLYGKFVTFDFVHANARSEPTLQLAGIAAVRDRPLTPDEVEIATLLDKSPTDFTWLPELRHIVGEDRAALHPALRSKASARVLVTEGKLSTRTGSLENSPRVWRFDPPLMGRELTTPLAEEVVLEIEDLEQAKVNLQEAGQPDEQLFFRPAKGAKDQVVTLTFIAACEGNPLEWEAGGQQDLNNPSVGPQVVRDQDFRWAYEFLSAESQEALRPDLGGPENGRLAPMPTFQGGGGDANRTNGCIGAYLGTVDGASEVFQS